MLTTSVQARLKSLYQSATSAAVSFEALRTLAGVHGLEGLGLFLEWATGTKLTLAKITADHFITKGGKMPGPLAISGDVRAFQVQTFAGVLELIRDIEEDLTQEATGLYTAAMAELDLSTCSWVVNTIMESGSICTAKIESIIARLKVRMGEGLQGGASTVELDPAEVHGETIHDIDNWILDMFEDEGGEDGVLR